MDELVLLSDILTVGWLLGLSAFASGSPLLALLASGSGVFFTRGVLYRWRAFEQAGMDAGQSHLHVGYR